MIPWVNKVIDWLIDWLTFSVVSLWNILYPPAYTKKNHYNFASLSCEKKQSCFYAKTWSWDVSWLFWRKFMAIRFFSDPVRVLSIRCNPIQVLLIRSDPVRVLSVRSDPIRSRFCKRPRNTPVAFIVVKTAWDAASESSWLLSSRRHLGSMTTTTRTLCACDVIVQVSYWYLVRSRHKNQQSVNFFSLRSSTKRQQKSVVRVNTNHLEKL